jgi:hypothetical protein
VSEGGRMILPEIIDRMTAIRIKICKVRSAGRLLGVEFYINGKTFFILKDQTVLEGVRVGRITPNLNEKFIYDLMFVNIC